QRYRSSRCCSRSSPAGSARAKSHCAAGASIRADETPGPDDRSACRTVRDRSSLRCLALHALAGDGDRGASARQLTLSFAEPSTSTAKIGDDLAQDVGETAAPARVAAVLDKQPRTIGHGRARAWRFAHGGRTDGSRSGASAPTLQTSGQGYILCCWWPNLSMR